MKFDLTRHWILSCATAGIALGLMGTPSAMADTPYYWIWTGGDGNSGDPATYWTAGDYQIGGWVLDTTHQTGPASPSGVALYIDGISGDTNINASSQFISIGGYSSVDIRLDNNQFVAGHIMTLGGNSTPSHLILDNHSILAGSQFQSYGSTIDILHGSEMAFGYGFAGDVTVDGVGSRLTISDGAHAGLHNSSTAIKVINGGTLYFGTDANINNSYSQYGCPQAVLVDGVGSSITGATFSTASDVTLLNGASLAVETLNTGSSQAGDHMGTRVLISGGSTVSLTDAEFGILGGLENAGKSFVTVTGRDTSAQVRRNTVLSGNGQISLSIGSRYATRGLEIQSGSAVNIGLDQNCTLSVGNGTFTNMGLIRLTAGTRVGIGDYTPIDYGNLSLSGTVSGNTYSGSIHALGGKWDGATHQVHVNYAKTAHAGDTISFDLMDTQRVRFTDVGTGKTLGISFLGSDVSKTLTVSAELVADPASSGLTSILASGDNGSYIDAWAIHPTAGYTQGEDAYLSIEVGANYDISTFKVWHYDGSVWTNYVPDDLSYDGLYAGFTVNGFSSYALSGGPSMSTSAVPEPASLGLIGLAGLGLLRRKRSA